MRIDRMALSGTAVLMAAFGVWVVLESVEAVNVLRGGFLGLFGLAVLGLQSLASQHADVRIIQWSLDRVADAYLRSAVHDANDAPPPPSARSPGVLIARNNGDGQWRDFRN